MEAECSSEFSSMVGVGERFLRRAGRPGSTAGEDARRHGQEGKIRFGGAHFRRDIAAKVF